MKRLPVLLLAAALFFPASSASAQIAFSLHGGLNLTVLSNESADTLLPINYTRVTGPSFGLATTLRLSPPDVTNSIGIQLSATYAARGGAVSGGTRTARLNYLELAALVDVRVPLPVEPLAVHVSLGPAAGWLASCNHEFEGRSEATPCVDDEFRALDYGLVFGGNLEIGLTDKLGVTAGFLYNVGVSYIDDYEGGTLKNRTLTLRGGLLYPIG